MSKPAGNPHVQVSSTLFHGTPIANAKGVLAHGIKPSGGDSYHRTNTRNAIFFSDELLGAFYYATLGDGRSPACVFEVDASGLDLGPDYDDASDVIEADLEELNRRIQKKWGYVSVGMELPEKKASYIVLRLDDMNDDERATPVSLSVVEDNGKKYLYAEPWVPMPVNDEEQHNVPELYDDNDIQWTDGTPFVLTRQYLCHCVLPASRIRVVWVDDQAAKKLGFDITKALLKKNIIDYSTIEKPETTEDAEGYEVEPDPDEVNFRTVVMYGFQMHQVAKNPEDPGFSVMGELYTGHRRPSKHAPRGGGLYAEIRKPGPLHDAVAAANKEARTDLRMGPAIDEWVAGCGDYEGRLEKTIRTQSDFYTRLVEITEPMRDALRARYGKTITLYRSQSPKERHPYKRTILSFGTHQSHRMWGGPYSEYHTEFFVVKVPIEAVLFVFMWRREELDEINDTYDEIIVETAYLPEMKAVKGRKYNNPEPRRDKFVTEL